MADRFPSLENFGGEEQPGGSDQVDKGDESFDSTPTKQTSEEGATIAPELSGDEVRAHVAAKRNPNVSDEQAQAVKDVALSEQSEDAGGPSDNTTTNEQFRTATDETPSDQESVNGLKNLVGGISTSSGGGSSSGGSSSSQGVGESGSGSGQTPTQELPHTLRVKPPMSGGGEYSVKVSGEIVRDANLEGPDAISGKAATGHISSGGVDKWRFSGDIERVIGSDGVRIFVDGQKVQTVRGNDSSGSSGGESARQTSLGGGGTATSLFGRGGSSSGDSSSGGLASNPMLIALVAVAIVAVSMGGGA